MGSECAWACKAGKRSEVNIIGRSPNPRAGRRGGRPSQGPRETSHRTVLLGKDGGRISPPAPVHRWSRADPGRCLPTPLARQESKVPLNHQRCPTWAGDGLPPPAKQPQVCSEPTGYERRRGSLEGKSEVLDTSRCFKIRILKQIFKIVALLKTTDPILKGMPHYHDGCGQRKISL